MGSYPEPRQHREARLVFALATDRTLSTKIDTSGLDWRLLIGIACRENAGIAVHAFFRKHPSTIPPQYARELAFLALDLRHRMRRLELRLEESLTALSHAGIEVVLLKGAAMALTVYGSFVARPMNDLDLLVDLKDVDRARRILLQAGWAPDPTLAGDEAYSRHHHLAPLIDTAGTGRRLELHTSLLPTEHPFNIPTELDRRALHMLVAGAPARILSPEDHAVHIAAHWIWSHEVCDGAWHAIRDVTTLLDRGALTIERFVNAAIRWRAGSCAYWTLRLARRLCDFVIADEQLRPLKPRASELVLSRLERHFEQMLLSQAESCPSVRINRALWSLAIRPSRSGHGESRPWLVSTERRALLPQTNGALGKLSRVARGINYLLNFV